MCQRLGTPNTPANPFHAGGEFRGFHGSLICYGLPGCSAPCTDLTGFPAIGAFYFQASNEIGPLLDITTASTGLLLAGLSPAGMAARLAARHTFSVRRAASISVCFLRDFCRVDNCRRQANSRPHACRRSTRYHCAAAI